MRMQREGRPLKAKCHPAAPWLNAHTHTKRIPIVDIFKSKYNTITVIKNCI